MVIMHSNADFTGSTSGKPQLQVKAYDMLFLLNWDILIQTLKDGGYQDVFLSYSVSSYFVGSERKPLHEDNSYKSWMEAFVLTVSALHFFARYQEALVINVCFDIGAFLLREVA